MAIVQVSDNNFQTEVESGGTVLVDFWAPWCGPCKMIAPVLEEISSDLGDKLKIAKVNVDENPGSAQRFGIMSIPTLMLVKDGQVVDKVIGFQPKENLMNAINKHL
ncbi:thioredoxin [Aneurinibacillus terranovensis]|uniref:thioredoxin n=1 Tax=Aneurinibacillus terranovensis TaxID=278991 RepID=UPI00041EB886|nr:thioredoxin [Aneurinibacillus terranovensis]